MKLEGLGIEGKVVDLSLLKHVMADHGFVLAGQWDYERVTFDLKFETHTNETFYLRVPGYAAEGEIDTGHALIKFLTPLLGKYYYPHGVEYGEGEKFPKTIVDRSKQLLQKVSEEITALEKDA